MPLPSPWITVFLHEFVVGGGMACEVLPGSWAREGAAMRRALASDFAAVPGVRVVATWDDRFGEEADAPWRTCRVGPGAERPTLERFASEADWVLVVAPETNGLLAERLEWIEKAGGRSLASSPSAVALTGDKLLTAEYLVRHGIPTIETLRVVPSAGLPTDARFYPAVLKPVDGAGSIETFVLEGPHEVPPEALHWPQAVFQRFREGVSLSATYLVDGLGRPLRLGSGRQNIVRRGPRLAYEGGTIPDLLAAGLEEAPARAVASVAGLFGVVGVDYLRVEESRVEVVEINPRPTTSIAGLQHLLPPGALARAWLDAAENRDVADAVARLADLVDSAPPLRFHQAGVLVERADQPVPN